MNRRDFIKKLMILPAIFVAPDVLGRIIPKKISGYKPERIMPSVDPIDAEPYSVDFTINGGNGEIFKSVPGYKRYYGEPPVRNITIIRDNVAESIDDNYIAVMHPDIAKDFAEWCPMKNMKDDKGNVIGITVDRENTLKKAGLTKKERFKYSGIESDFKINSETGYIDWVGGNSKNVYSIKEFEGFLKSDDRISYNLAGNNLELKNRLIGHEATQHLNYGSIKDKLGTYAWIKSFGVF